VLYAPSCIVRQPVFSLKKALVQYPKLASGLACVATSARKQTAKRIETPRTPQRMKRIVLASHRNPSTEGFFNRRKVLAHKLHPRSAHNAKRHARPAGFREHKLVLLPGAVSNRSKARSNWSET
jgi:hypothetical protein